jgi:ankyrin repeat protein
MVRDQNGYTALLKAAALGRTEMCKSLVRAGVDPRHVDPYGNTAREKAELYNHTKLAEWLLTQESKARSGQL